VSLSVNPFKKGVKRKGLAVVIFGACFVVGGLLFAFAPVGLAFLLAPFSGGVDNGSGGGSGVVIWFMILTLPVGTAVAMFGLVTMIGGTIATLRMKLPTEQEDAVTRNRLLSHRAIALASLLPLSLIPTPIVAFVLTNMVAGGNSGTTAFYVIAAMQLVAGGFALYFAIRTKRTALIAILAGVVLLSLAGSYALNAFVVSLETLNSVENL